MQEFERLVTKTPKVVGEHAADSWLYLLWGAWTSALRLEKLMRVSWDDPNFIMPVWPKRRRPVLMIPAEMQKNATEESIPLLPDFERLLHQTPPASCAGWVFNPQSLQANVGRQRRHGRPQPDWVGKVISRIGEAANVVVSPASEKLDKPAKFASTHDLRRSCGERLVDSGVPQAIIQRILRHASWDTTKRFYVTGAVQKDAETLWELLKPADIQAADDGSTVSARRTAS